MVQVKSIDLDLKSGKIDRMGLLKKLLIDNSYLDAESINGALDAIKEPSSQKELSQALEIAHTLIDLKMDSESVVVALLLRVVRTNKISPEIINKAFGDSVSNLITGVVKMDAIKGIQDKVDLDNSNYNVDLKADQIRKMLIAMVKDPRVVVIRLAEHLSELRAVSKASDDIQQALAQETKLIFAPLANRLGIGQIKWQLEDYAFRYLESDTYKSIAKLLDEKRVDRDNYIKNIIDVLEQKLAAVNIKAEVTGRVKHIYSIWRKMKRKNVEFDELYDIRAVRILTNSLTDCYAALGMVHGSWQHIPKEFDDYVATPKDNGYQSLHTAVFGPEGKIIEVQIRTHDMHNDSELGVAAHWRYKEGVAHDKSFDTKIAWLRQLIEWQDELSTSSELLEELQTDIAEDRVYVLTPKGDVFDLPEGATPLDLAYLIHTEVGNKCCGAKVNNKMVPLTYSLQTGDQVDLLTRSNNKPSRDWLNPHFNFIKTPRARSKVQSWFKKQDYGRNLIDGREILERELQRLGVDKVDFTNVVAKLNFKTEDDILAALARGDVKLAQILNLSGVLQTSKQVKLDDIPVITSEKKLDQHKSSKGINISGVENLLTSLAGCCKPIPGNPIVGYISQGRGITIHTQDCLNIEHITVDHPERLIEVDWGANAEDMYFAADLFIKSRDRQGLLRDLTGLLSAEKINIVNLTTNTDKDGLVHTYITIEVSSLSSLKIILDKIQALPSVIKAAKISSSG